MISLATTGDNEPLKAFYEKMKNDKLMQKPKHEHPVILRGNLLLHAHVLRLTGHLSPVSLELLHHHCLCISLALFSISYAVSRHPTPTISVYLYL